jgi:hypothetical protein
LNHYSPQWKGVIPKISFILTSPLDNKYSTISLWPAEEAVNKTTLIQILSILFDHYSPEYKGLYPKSSLKFTSAPFNAKHSTVFLWPSDEAVNEKV